MKLTEVELKLVQAAARGDTFSVQDEPTKDNCIRAEVIRDLFFQGIALSEPSSDKYIKITVKVSDSGLKIQGAKIQGRLILDGVGRSSTNGAPALHLTHCELDGGISAANAIIADIDLSNSVFLEQENTTTFAPPLNISSTKISGSLTVNGLHGEKPDTPAWIKGQGVEIQNGIFASNARLYYPAKKSLGTDDLANYAFDLNSSIISGGFNSTSGLVCHGGFCILNAAIKGDIWLLGSHLIGGEKASLRAQGLNLAGSLIFRPTENTDGSVMPAKSEGEIDLFSASVSGAIHLSGLDITNHPKEDRIGIKKISINLGSGQIGDSLSAGLWIGDRDNAVRFSSAQKFEMSNANIGGNVSFSSSSLGASDDEYGNLISLNCFGLNVTGNVTLSALQHAGITHQMELDGALIFDRAKITGNFSSQFLTIKDEKSAWFLMQAATVSGGMSLQNWNIAGGIKCANTEFKGAGSLHLKRPSLDGFSKPQSVQIDLASTVFRSTLWIHADVSQLNLFGSDIHGQTVLDISATSSVGLMRANIDGDLFFRNFRFQEPYDKKGQETNHLLQLKGTNINGNLKILLPKSEDVSDLLITNAWSKELICYPDWTFIEVEISRSSGTWYASFLKPRNDSSDFNSLYLCNSRSLIFHQLNSEKQLDISNPEAAAEYLKLFSACTWGDHGPFAIVENASELPLDHIDKVESEKYPAFDIQTLSPIESIDPETPILKTDKHKRIPPKNEAFLFKAYMRYSHMLFQTYMSLSRSGHVEMVDDQPKTAFQKSITPQYSPPLRHRSDFFNCISDLVPTPNSDMHKLTKNQLDELQEELEQLIKDDICPHNFSNAKIDLSEASVNGLDDNDGAGWGDDVQLNLINFKYNNYSSDTKFDVEKEGVFAVSKRMRKNAIATIFRGIAHRLLDWGFSNSAKRIMQSRLTAKLPKPKIEKIRDRIKHRLDWLELQYPQHPEKLSNFSARFWLSKLPFSSHFLSRRRFNVDLYESQPYSQAAGVFRKEGESKHARAIDYVQRKLTGQKHVRHAGFRRPFVWLLNTLFNLSSGFGLSPIRTITVTLLLIGAGGIMTNVANHKGLLIIDALPVTQSASELNGVAGELTYSKELDGWRMGEVFCGESIEPLLYATDIFIPLLDLRQEIRCMIRPSNSHFENTLNHHPKNQSAYDALIEFIASNTTNNIQLWHWFRSAYSILGWIMVSLLIYTLSHSLRAKDSL